MISPEALKEIISLIKNDKLLFEYGYVDHKSTKEKRDSYVFVAGGLSMLKAGTIGIDPIGLATYKSYKVIKDNIVYIHGANNTPFYIIRQDDKISLRKKLPLLNDKSLLIHELVSNWAKHPLEETANRIFKLTPAMYAKVDSQLYRGVTLSPPAMLKLSKGMKVTLEDRKFSSWSEDISLASTFIRNNGAIMKHVGPLEVVININLFEEKVFGSLEYYPRNNEKEYILHNTPDILVVHPLQVFYYRESQHKFLKYDDFVKDYKKNEKLYASTKKESIEKEILKLIKSGKLVFNYGILKEEKRYDEGWYLHNNSLELSNKFVIWGGHATIGVAKFKSFQIIQKLDLEEKSPPKIGKSYSVIKDQEDIKLDIKLPLLNDQTMHIHELICGHGGTSMFDNTESHIKYLRMLGKIEIPNIFKNTSGKLFRKLTLSPKAIEKLKEDKPIRLQNRKFSSWSEEFEIAKNFEMDIIEGTEIVIEYIAKTDDVLININLFEEKVFGDIYNYPYCNEKEIILINSKDMLTIHPKQVCFIDTKVKKKPTKPKFLTEDDTDEKLYDSNNKIKIEYVDPEDYNYKQMDEAERVVTDSGLRMLRNDEVYCIALSGKKVIGVLYYSFDNEELRISIAVDEKYRQKGIAKQLFEKVETIPEYDYAKVIIGELVPPYTLEGLLKKNKYKYSSTEGTFKIYKKRIKK